MVICSVGGGLVYTKPHLTQRLIDSMDAVKFQALGTDEAGHSSGDVITEDLEAVGLERIVSKIAEDGNHTGEIVQIEDGGFRRGGILVYDKDTQLVGAVVSYGADNSYKLLIRNSETEARFDRIDATKSDVSDRLKEAGYKLGSSPEFGVIMKGFCGEPIDPLGIYVPARTVEIPPTQPTTRIDKLSRRLFGEPALEKRLEEEIYLGTLFFDDHYKGANTYKRWVLVVPNAPENSPARVHYTKIHALITQLTSNLGITVSYLEKQTGER